tara:strand:- start:3596 stop:5245 length:1650 start_codon:yes stop_codon:yes gene_type:complete
MWILIGGGKPQWNTLSHNGPYFAEPYEKHDIPVIINKEKIVLGKLAEEYATLYAKYVTTDYINNSTFNKNFTKDFFKVLPKDLVKKFNLKSVIEIDFIDINKKLEKDRLKRLERSKETKEKEKKDRLENEEPYIYCMIDGAKVKVGNYKIEPPGIFLGRGSHPKLGMIKKRINPEDITINLGKDSQIPKPNVSGKWGKIIHEKDKIWLASWKDDITGKTKYVFTSVESIFKSKSDMDKFDLARKLKRKVNTIRQTYLNELDNEDLKIKQLATALYFIDNLALRVGGKKDSKEQADTVGVTSLRVEHITFLENNTIKLDFLGKDSIRYCQKVSVDSRVYLNLQQFTNEKDKKKDLFNMIDSKSLNSYLENFLKGLTAKVWRTYNASSLFQKELDKIKPEKICGISESERINYLLGLFNMANTKVALLCNHQKNVPSNISKILEKINTMMKKLKKQKKKLKEKKFLDAEKKEENNKKLNRIDSKIILLKLKKETKSKMKNVSLGTSKMNYIDPRIVFGFIKRFDIPPEKLFTKALLARFEWANNVDKDYKF